MHLEHRLIYYYDFKIIEFVSRLVSLFSKSINQSVNRLANQTIINFSDLTKENRAIRKKKREIEKRLKEVEAEHLQRGLLRYFFDEYFKKI